MDTNSPDSFSRLGGEGFWSTQEKPCVWGWGEILPPQAWAGNSQENTMAFSPAACVLLHTLRDKPAPRMSPQLHKREKRTKKRKKSSSDASQMLLPVSGSAYPTCHNLPPSLCLALAQDRACRWHCFQLGRQLASVPLTKGYSHRLLGSESNHTSLTNHRASSSWCNHSHTDTDAHTHSHTPHTHQQAHIHRRAVIRTHSLNFSFPPSA